MLNPRIYTFSILYSTTEAFIDKLPYVTAILETESGERFAALLEGYKSGSEVKVGQEVKLIAQNEFGKNIYSL